MIFPDFTDIFGALPTALLHPLSPFIRRLCVSDIIGSREADAANTALETLNNVKEVNSLPILFGVKDYFVYFCSVLLKWYTMTEDKST